ncbi:MAG: tRNA pseudouridine(55) synthase TruB [Deltaproteobacteria bacterium]|nr:tRNA pseudouridine(55) synthase TruB [Deltaproteobacteria bacterium]
MRSGFLIIDKPAGITSHDVVALFRAVTGAKKVGHTGTLDPFATGVLPLAIGGATRLIQFLDESVKVYDATIRLGAATDTGDPTGKVIREAPLPTATEDEVRTVLATFLGDRMQEPPAYSAVKVGGRPLYHYARKGEEVRAAARPVKITDCRLLSYDGATLRVEITCSRGTYARVLADEIAVALGTAGHLEALSRTRSGPFYLDAALTVAQLADLVAAEPGHSWEEVLLARSRRDVRIPWKTRDEVDAGLAPWMRSAVRALPDLPLVDVIPLQARRIRNGGNLPAAPGGTPFAARYLVVSGDEIVAVGEHTTAGPKVVRVMDA